MKIPYFEIKRMIEKAFETLEGRHCVPTRARKMLEERYLGNDLVTLRELSEKYGMSTNELLGIDMKNLAKIRRYLARKGYTDFITNEIISI